MFFYMQLSSAYVLKADTVLMVFKEVITEQIIVTIENTEKELLWLWINNNEESVSDSVAIRHFFMKRHGDFSLFEIGVDPNMESCLWHPSAQIELFVKCIEPNHSFTFVFYKEVCDEEIKKNNCFSVDSIKIYNNTQVTRYCPGIDTSWSINRISYPHNAISYYVSGKKCR